MGAEKDEGDEAIPYLRFEPRAQRVFDRWHGGLERRLRCGEEHPALESHFAKYRSLIPSIALLIHVADAGKGPVSLEALRKALAWGRYLSSHARRIYGVAVMDDVAAARRLVARIRKGDIEDGFTERDVYRNDWSGLDRESVRKAVAVLVEYGWLCTQDMQTEGRRKMVCRINPQVLKGPPDPTDKADRSSTADADGSREGTDSTDRSGAARPVSARGPWGTTDETDRSPDDGWGEL